MSCYALRNLRSLGAKLRLDEGGELRYRGVSDSLEATIKAHKPQIIKALQAEEGDYHDICRRMDAQILREMYPDRPFAERILGPLKP